MNLMEKIAAPLMLTLLLAGTAAAANLPDFTAIVKEHSSAVVKIEVESQAGSGEFPGGDEIPEFLRRYFGVPPEGRGPQQPRMGTGSGFIISDDGYIVTNNHVVEDATSVVVRLSDRREFDAEIIGTDPSSDLALLKVEGDDLPVLELASRDDLEVGQWVLAIGSPFGFDYSVTAGIVSAKGRSLYSGGNGNYVPFIQTDVAINPGNSGGPLFNLDGEVVGVNSQILTRSGGSIGMSFAIPVSVVNNVVKQLKEDGQVTRGWLGVSIQDVDRTLAESFGLDRPMGALVASVVPDSPAEKGKIKTGDIILVFDGQEIMTSADLPHVVGMIAPGTRAKVELLRDQKRRTLTVEVGALDSEQLAARDQRGGSTARGGPLGLVVATASDEELEGSGLSGAVIVSEVVPGGLADEGGIRRGDLITMVGSSPVKSAEAFERAVDKLEPGSSARVRVVRRGAPLFIGLRLPEE